MDKVFLLPDNNGTDIDSLTNDLTKNFTKAATEIIPFKELRKTPNKAKT